MARSMKRISQGSVATRNWGGKKKGGMGKLRKCKENGFVAYINGPRTAPIYGL